MVLGLVAFLGSTASTAAADTCPNEVFRTGPSKKLPECRAYELVSPSFTGGVPPTALNFLNIQHGFEAPLITSSADSVIFNTFGGALRGFPGTGFNDRYRAKRTADGWVTEFVGAAGGQTPFPVYGGVSADHEYYFVNAGGGDFELDPGASLQAPFGGQDADYMHTPSGEFELIARGSLGESKNAVGNLITPGAGHVIFEAQQKLEPNAPTTGTKAVYDRSPGGATNVVSLLPGNVTPSQHALYLGASADGTEIAFAVDGKQVSSSVFSHAYVRIDNTTTKEVALSDTMQFAFAGIFGDHVFYTDGVSATGEVAAGGGNLYSFDIADGTTTVVTNVGDARFTNVSNDGSRVYFVSESQIEGQGTAGQPNLYVWSRSDEHTSYVTTVAISDVQGVAGLAGWIGAVGPHKEAAGGSAGGGGAEATSRATPDGSVLAFESKAQLTSFDNTEESAEDCGQIDFEGNPVPGQSSCKEVYRYDAISEELTCVSCPSGDGPATGEASLQTLGLGFGNTQPLSVLQPAASLTTDGEMVFFESTEGILPQDGNGKRDVYRWRKGTGIALVSTGQSPAVSYLYAVTPTGSDVVIHTAQKLVPQDLNGATSALYDVRVGGGFPPPEETVTESCAGDICQGSPSAQAEAPRMTSRSLVGDGNVGQSPRCRKGTHKASRKGKARCVKNRKHRRAGSHRRADR